MLNALHVALRVAILLFALAGLALAADSPIKGVKLGFGLDRGLGVTANWQDINGFVGTDGSAVDYLFARGKFPLDETMYWYVGGGGFIDWDGDWGARVPFGAELPLNEKIDIYAQVIPGFRANHDAKFQLKLGLGIRYQF